MEKQSPELNGAAFFSDPRLVANGFKVKLTPGTKNKSRKSCLTLFYEDITTENHSGTLASVKKRD